MRSRPMCLICLLTALWTLGLAGMGKLSPPSVPDVLEGERLRVTGEVYRLEQTEKNLWIYLKHISMDSHKEVQYQSHVAVITKSEYELSIGNRILAEGVCQIPGEASNPGQFDMAAYYGAQGVGMQLKKAKIQVLDTEVLWLLQTLQELRKAFREGLCRVLGKEDGGLLAAMLLGEKGGLDQEVKKLYQAGGISHILAISGLHISLIGISLYRLLRRWMGGFTLPSVVSAACLILYGILTGMPVSAKRAILMFLVYLGAQILGRTYDLLSALALAGVLILLEEPRYLFQAGFQLSFLSVVGIGVIYPAMRGFCREKHKLLDALWFSMSIQLATLPATLYWYGQVAVFSPILNLAVLPLAGTAMASAGVGTMIGFLWPGGGMMAAAACHYILRLYESLCLLTAAAGRGHGVWGAPKGWRILVYYLILSAGAVWGRRMAGTRSEKDRRPGKKRRNRMLNTGVWAAIGLACICLMAVKIPGGLELTFLDVEQGDCIFWQSEEGTTYLCDGGSTTVSRVGEYRIEPFLKWKGVGILDYLILTHMDADHINGAQELLASHPGGIRVGCLVLPDIVTEDEAWESLRAAAQSCGTAVRYLGKGDILRDGRLLIRCLYPHKGSKVGEKEKNEYSLVLQLSYGRFRTLLTGDLEGRGENAILEKGELEDMDLLKVAHHGSAGSTGEGFLEKIRPEVAILSYGEGNQYGHPHKELIDRLKRAGCRLYETAKQGAVTVRSDGESYEVSTYR